MIKTFLISLALVLVYALTGIASESPDISEQTLGENDTLIYLPGESSDIPMILHKERNYMTLSPYQPRLSTPQQNGIALDVPVNDDCANAIAIGEVDSLPASTMEATLDGSDFSAYPNIWYLYTPSETGRVRAFIGHEDGDPEVDGGIITVYDGNICPEAVGIPETSFLQGGETIEDAVSITDPLPVSYRGNLIGYVRDYHNCSCMLEHDYVGPDAVYSYTAESDDQIDIILGNVSGDLDIIIMDENGNELACSNWEQYHNVNDEIDGQAIFNFPVTASDTYYLIVSGNYNEGDYEYTLYIFEPDYEIINMSYWYWCTGSYVDFDAIAGHRYLIEIGYEHPSPTTYLTIEPIPDPPVNDVCEYAQDGGVLEAVSTIQFTGDNTGATMTCPFIFPYPEIWIKFTLEDTLTVRMDYCGNTSIGNLIAQAYVMTKDCPHNSEGWYFGEEDMDFPNCPNPSMILWWNYLPPGTYYYPMIVHDDYEGYYSINITGMARQECKDEAWYGQSPTSIRQQREEFYYSDFEAGFASVDKFEDVAGPINEITWWGINIDPSGEVSQNCEPESPYPFEIVFCNPNQSSPYLPGDTAAIYEVYPEIIETGFNINAYTDNEIPQRKYTATLNEPINIEDGWIMIRGNDGINDCAFAWQNSVVNEDNALIYDAIENIWSRTHNSFAFCLSEGTNAIDDEPEELPNDYELIQNYPNPFNATTSIQFSLKQTDDIILSIYDISGRLIRKLYNGSLSAGMHRLIWDGTNQSGEIVSSGIYFYKLSTSEKVFSNKMVLLK